MGIMKLYRLLQALVGDVNQIVVGLHQETIAAEAAKADAIAKLEAVLTELKAE